MSGITRSADVAVAEPLETLPTGRVGLRGLVSVSGTLLTTFSLFAFFALQGIVLARMLGPQGRGAFAAAIAYPQMLLYLGFLGAADLYARRAAILVGDDASLRRSALRFGMLTGTLTMFVSGLLIAVAMPLDKRVWIPLALLVAATLPFQHVRFAVQAIDHGQGRFNRYNVSRLLGAAAAPLALAAAWLLGLRTVSGAILVYCTAMLAAVGLIRWGMNQTWWGPAEPSAKVALREGRGFAGSQVFSELLDRADVGLILWLGTLVEQGFYAAAVPIAGTMAIVPMAVATYTFRHGAAGQRALSGRQVTIKLCILLLAQTTTALALAAVLPIVVPILYGDAFAPAIRFAWCLLPAAALRGIVIAVDGYLRGRDCSRPGIVARLVALAVLLGCTAGLYRQCGVFAIPIALGIAQSVAALMVAVAMYFQADRSSVPAAETAND